MGGKQIDVKKSGGSEGGLGALFVGRTSHHLGERNGGSRRGERGWISAGREMGRMTRGELIAN